MKGDTAPVEDQPQTPLAVVAEALRIWQRPLGTSALGCTTLWIDRAEEPAQVVLDALAEAGFDVVARTSRSRGHFGSLSDEQHVALASLLIEARSVAFRRTGYLGRSGLRRAVHDFERVTGQGLTRRSW